MALSEEVCNWGWGLRLQKPIAFPVYSLCLVVVDQDASAQLFLLLQFCFDFIDCDPLKL